MGQVFFPKFYFVNESLKILVNSRPRSEVRRSLMTREGLWRLCKATQKGWGEGLGKGSEAEAYIGLA